MLPNDLLGTAPAYTPPKPLAAPKPLIGAVPAATDFYSKLIQGNPGYIQGAANIYSKGVYQNTGSAEGYRRNAIQWGLVPDELQDPNGWLDPTTRQLAQENTTAGLSTTARLQRAHEIAVQQLRRRLAARGMLESGGLNSDSANEALSYRQSYADALSNFLDQERGVRDTYLQNALGRQQDLADLAAKYATWAQGFTPPPAAANPNAAAIRAINLRGAGMNTPAYSAYIKRAYA